MTDSGPRTERGQVITFYSFKGGTGRTMALANVAYVLAEQGKRVLAIDFDLEAPGLSSYFEAAFDVDLGGSRGLIELLTDVRSVDDALERWRGHTQSSGFAGLDVITSGARSDEYASRVGALDWDELFHEREGGEVLEALRDAWTREYAYVFVDSRTGLTDTGGVCTIHLPDVIVPMSTPNRQSLEGVVDVVERAQRQRRNLARERGPALVFPIVSRLDDRTEKEQAARWMDEAEKRLGDFVAPWLPLSVPVRQLLERTKLPYVTYYSFGEAMPVVVDNRYDPAALGSALRTVAAVIGNRFGDLPSILGDTSAASVPAAAEAFRTLVGADPETEARAHAALARLWEPPADGFTAPPARSAAVPSELLGDHATLAALQDAGLVSVKHGWVSAAKIGSPDEIPGLPLYMERNARVLRWASAVRRTLVASLDNALGGDQLSEGLEYYEQSAEALTPFERSLIERSLDPPEPPRRGPLATATPYAAAGAVLGIFITLLRVSTGRRSEFDQSDALIIGVATAFGAYFGLALSFLLRNRDRRRAAHLDLEPGWSSLRDIAKILKTMGYEADVHGALAVFRIAKPHSGNYLHMIFLPKRASPEQLSVVLTRVEAGQDHRGYTVRGPAFAVARLERAFAGRSQKVV